MNTIRSLQQVEEEFGLRFRDSIAAVTAVTFAAVTFAAVTL